MGKLCFGVDLGGTAIKLGLFDSEDGLLESWEIVTRKEEGGSLILDDISAAILKKMEERNISKEEILGVGIGVPGPVTSDGYVNSCVNLGWGRFDVAKELGNKIGMLVKVGNDANVAALGEMWQGGAQGYQHVVMITLGTGVGGGIIINGKIWEGVNGAAGELGHMPVVYDEKETCNCGRKGCLEQVASATGIVKVAKRLLNETDKPSSLRKVQYISAKEVFDAAKNGDELANDVLENMGEYMGIALANVASVVDPEIFVIGGGVSKAGTILIDLIQKYYKTKTLFSTKNTKFALARLGNDAGIYGAAKMVLG